MGRYKKITDGAMITNIDEASDPKYYGYVRPEGSWIIMKSSSAETVFKYAIGGSDYSTAWTGRAGLTYRFVFELPEL